MNEQVQQELQKLGKLALKYAHNEGQSETAISYFGILKSTKPRPLSHGILTPSFCVVLQGNKKVLLGTEILKYGAGYYLASIVDVPAAGQIIGATEKNPYLGLRIDFTTEEINSVIFDAKLKLKKTEKVKSGAFKAEADLDLLESFCKLFQLLESSSNVEYLAGLLKKEILYRLLTGEQGHLFYQNMILDPEQKGVGKVITWIKENFDKPLSIEQLAKTSNMSVSSLHHKFKSFMSMGPLQYQKQLRLQEARRLLMNGEDDATKVAMTVGYESASQFSREYKRLFGLPPKQDLKAMTKTAPQVDLNI
jgi:AraC-like DNA-binding protein